INASLFAAFPQSQTMVRLPVTDAGLIQAIIVRFVYAADPVPSEAFSTLLVPLKRTDVPESTTAPNNEVEPSEHEVYVPSAVSAESRQDVPDCSPKRAQ